MLTSLPGATQMGPDWPLELVAMTYPEEPPDSETRNKRSIQCSCKPNFEIQSRQERFATGDSDERLSLLA